MAKITGVKNGVMSVKLDEAEQSTYEALPAGQLERYITIWLEERGKKVFAEKLANMTPAKRAKALAALNA